MAKDRSARFNAKARQSTAGGSKSKKSQGKGKSFVDAEPVEAQTQADVNAEVIVPMSKEEKEEHRRRKEEMRKELAAEQNSKMSNKKRKRLDAYIERQLKKEARIELLKKLSTSQAPIGTTSLQSSSTLGSRQYSTTSERLTAQEQTALRKALRKGLRKGKGWAQGAGEEGEEEDVDADLDREGENEPEPEPLAGPSTSRSPPPQHAPPPKPAVVDPSTVQLGGALARNAEGQAQAPVFVPRKKRKPNPAGPHFSHQWRKPEATPAREESGSESDSSFDSSDSAYDENESADEAGSWKGMGSGNQGGETEAASGSEEGSSKDEDEDDDDSDSNEPAPKRSTGFKAWALSQMAAAGAPIPSSELADSSTRARSPTPPPSYPIVPAGVPLPAGPARALAGKVELPAHSLISLDPSGGAKSSTTKHVPVKRSEELQAARLLLPVVELEQEIVEAILINPVVVICGETGSGKTTQVPQFLYERGFGSAGSDNPGMIGITQPRRVAAISMSARVSSELSLPAPRVAYQIRYDATTSPETAIKFMTDGVLLRELAHDFLLARYSVVVVDEAHERSVNTDILIGVLSRVVKLREEMWRAGKEGVKPLRLVIMSATLRVTDFTLNTTLFPTPPPVINVSARQHPVTVHFARRTRPDYLDEAFKKTVKIHARLPPGGVLVFLTGQGEIQTLCRRLERRFGKKAVEERRERGRKVREAWRSRMGEEDRDRENDAADVPRIKVTAATGDVEAEEVDLGEDADLALDVDDGAELEQGLDSDSDDESGFEEAIMDEDDSETPMHILPLYSLLPSDKQMRVFEPPPEGHRLVVVATNVAETSLTIPGIRYVVDAGRAKERHYDVTSGIQSFRVSWVSKASAAQRSGRAGRTGPGHCYRLYSSAVFEDHFDAFAQPEILRMPIEGVVLQMKSMNIDAVANFPFPTPPDKPGLAKAEKVLTYLGALEPVEAGARVGAVPGAGSTSRIGGRVTELGRAMAMFPVAPRFAKMLVAGQQHGCLPYIIAIVAALSVGDPFIREAVLAAEENGGADDENDVLSAAEIRNIKSAELRENEERKLRRRKFFKVQQLYSALGNASSDMFKLLVVIGAYEYAGGGEKFCTDNFVRFKAMQEIHKLRAQISSIVQSTFPGVDTGFVPKLQPPNDTQLKVLRQLLTAGFIDQVAVRKDVIEPSSATAGAKFASTRGIPYRAMGVAGDVFIHPSSVLFHNAPPDFVVYTELLETSQVFLRGVTKINAAWLPTLGRALCTFSKPLDMPAGAAGVLRKDHAASRKPGDPETRECFVEPSFGPGLGWKLPPIKVLQRKEQSGRWVFI